MARLGPITWDFEKLEMRFKWGNQKVLLTGIQHGSVREVKLKKKHQIQGSGMQFHMIYAYEETEEEPLRLNVLGVNTEEDKVDERIEELTIGFADIFTEPKGLPPFRANHNHKIVLKEGGEPTFL